MCIHGRDGGMAKKKRKTEKTRNMQLDHSVTHVKRKENKNEMGTTKTARNAHNLEKAKQNRINLNKTCRALLAEKNMQTQTGVRDIRPAVRTIWAVSVTGGTPLWYLCCEISSFQIGLLICLICNG